MFLKDAVLKSLGTATLCAGLLAWGGPLSADEYRPSEFLGLDLSKAVLSPRPLGPPAQFSPVPIEANSESHVAQTTIVEPKPAAGIVVRNTGNVVRKPRIVERTENPRGAARVKLAKRHGNPLDAQASDRRIQVWPCKTGGICDWQH
jgi:hypothetical protein